jgi:hypothetical protein
LAADLHKLARDLGGVVRGEYVYAPGPGHSKHDRSMWAKRNWQAPQDDDFPFIFGSFAGDAWHEVKDDARAKAGIGSWRPKKRDGDRPSPARRRLIVPEENNNRPESTFWRDLWFQTQHLRGTLGDIYLRHRVGRGVDQWPADLRFHPACPRRTERHPAIVGLLRDIRTNTPRAIQRVYLQPDGRDRLRDGEGKLTLGHATGCALKITPDAEITTGLALAEGVEKALALMAIGVAPIWATSGTATLGNFPVLAGIDALTVYGDNDLPNRNGEQPGQRAALKCKERWNAESDADVRIIIPKTEGFDWSDALSGAA